jgi:hypothetical protein
VIGVGGAPILKSLKKPIVSSSKIADSSPDAGMSASSSRAHDRRRRDAARDHREDDHDGCNLGQVGHCHIPSQGGAERARHVIPL